jgi:hypothetical protein
MEEMRRDVLFRGSPAEISDATSIAAARRGSGTDLGGKSGSDGQLACAEKVDSDAAGGVLHPSPPAIPQYSYQGDYHFQRTDIGPPISRSFA